MRPRSHAIARPAGRWAWLGPGLGAAACIAAGALPGHAPAQEVAGFESVRIAGPFRTLDGDTFEGDLNGDGRLETPEERVRLLYVDTPELAESHKGTDRVRGEAAREFLARWLERGAVTLLVPRERPKDRFGRTLALARANGEEVNRLLVREGHGTFDTRFNFPADYDHYAEAEGKAFAEKLGIWSDARSRDAYLRRLEREWRTPRSERNPRFGGRFAAEAFDGRLVLEKYVRVTGRLAAVNGVQARAVRVQLDRGAGAEPVRAVLLHPLTERLRMTRWAPGATVVLEGFVRGGPNRAHIVIHYAAVTPRAAEAEARPRAARANR